MAKIDRYTGNYKPFGANSQGTERTIFEAPGATNTQSDTLDENINTDYLRGWGDNVVGPSQFPTRQQFNAGMFTLGQTLAYIHQEGVPEWDSSQEFNIDSTSKRNGVIYRSTVNGNIGNDPALGGFEWKALSELRYSSIADLKSSSPAIGEIVSTGGYYSDGDGGGASYLIAATQAVDGYSDHALANGNVALLQEETPSLKQFGAKGDGVTDDKSSVQAALSSTKHSRIFVNNSCEFLIDNSVSGLSIAVDGKVLVGSGVIKASAIDVDLLLVTSADVVISGISVAGNGLVDDTFSGPVIPALISTDGDGRVSEMNITVSGVTFINPGTCGLNIFKCVGAKVVGCTVKTDQTPASLVGKSPFIFCIRMYASAYVVIEGNAVRGLIQGVLCGAYDEGVYDFDDFSGTISNKNRNFAICNNVIENQFDHSIYTSNNNSDYVVSGNVCNAALRPITGLGNGGLKVEGVRFTASDNKVTDGIVMRNCQDCVIDSNVIQVKSGYSTQYGILHNEQSFKRNVSNVVITNNIIGIDDGADSLSGIFISGEVWDGFQAVISNLNISNNVIIGFGGGSFIGSGIRISQSLESSGGFVIDSPARSVVIEGNSVISSADPAAQVYGVDLSQIEGLSMHNNTLREFTLSGGNFSGVRKSIIEGNLLFANTDQATTRYGFVESQDDATVRLPCDNNSYRNNYFEGLSAPEYLPANSGTSIVAQIETFDAGASNSNKTVRGLSGYRTYLWSPTTGGLTLTLDELRPWTSGQRLDILNGGSSSFTVQPAGVAVPAGGRVTAIYQSPGVFKVV